MAWQKGKDYGLHDDYVDDSNTLIMQDADTTTLIHRVRIEIEIVSCGIFSVYVLNIAW